LLCLTWYFKEGHSRLKKSVKQYVHVDIFRSFAPGKSPQNRLWPSLLALMPRACLEDQQSGSSGEETTINQRQSFRERLVSRGAGLSFWLTLKRYNARLGYWYRRYCTYTSGKYISILSSFYDMMFSCRLCKHHWVRESYRKLRRRLIYPRLPPAYAF
jgi:hypothetical protein